ncbi:hypothetical protein N3K66_004172 [Trichothecium roseum]|uniref:Uncharacterized protein n=1 Tax=Trichothecium roseum TaxID=47278 RepID=A0ACC0V0J5_9HYPO|nr:hypothetical protein N3K66_004172 [Trichothecium roseum]
MRSSLLWFPVSRAGRAISVDSSKSSSTLPSVHTVGKPLDEEIAVLMTFNLDTMRRSIYHYNGADILVFALIVTITAGIEEYQLNVAIIANYFDCS